MHHTSQINAAAHWSYLLPERLGQCQKAWQKLMSQWISQSIIIMHSCHCREAKSCLQGNPHQDTNVAARGVVLWPWKLLLGCGYFSCAVFLCQLSSFLPKSCLPALPDGCSLVQPWRPPHLWLWRGAQDNTEQMVLTLFSPVLTLFSPSTAVFHCFSFLAPWCFWWPGL